MKYNISDYKLDVIIEELGEEYKNLLIERVLEDMREIDVDLINPSDLIRLDVTTKSSLRSGKREQKRYKMLTMIALVGIMYAMFGLLIMLWSEIRYIIKFDSAMFVAFIFIFSGLFLSLFSLVFRTMLKMRPQYYKNKIHTISLYEIIDKWKELEALVNQLTPEKDSWSLTSMLENLKETKIISEDDVKIIMQLLNIRNQIMHGKEEDKVFSQVELRTVLLDTDKIIAKLKRLL